MLAVIQEREEKRPGKDGKEETATVRELVLRSAMGPVSTQRLPTTSGGARRALASRCQPGRSTDLIALTPYEKAKIFLQRKEPAKWESL